MRITNNIHSEFFKNSKWSAFFIPEDNEINLFRQEVNIFKFNLILEPQEQV